MCTSPGDSWRSTSSLDDLTVGEHLVVSDLIPLKLLVLAVYRVKRSRRRRRWKLRKGMNAIQRAPLGYKSPLEKRNEPFRWRLNSNDVERYILQPMKNFFLSFFILLLILLDSSYNRSSIRSDRKQLLRPGISGTTLPSQLYRRRNIPGRDIRKFASAVVS